MVRSSITSTERSAGGKPMARQSLSVRAGCVLVVMLVGALAGCQTWHERGLYPSQDGISRASQGEVVYEMVKTDKGELVRKTVDVRTELLQLVRTAPETERRAMAARDLLAFKKDAKVVDALITALHNDRHSQVRKRAAESLAEMDDPRVVGVLRVAMKRDHSSRVRYRAVRALGMLRASEAVGDLRDAAFSDGSRRVRHAAMMALANVDANWVPPVNAGPARGLDDARRGPRMWLPFPAPWGWYTFAHP